MAKEIPKVQSVTGSTTLQSQALQVSSQIASLEARLDKVIEALIGNTIAQEESDTRAYAANMPILTEISYRLTETQNSIRNMDSELDRLCNYLQID